MFIEDTKVDKNTALLGFFKKYFENYCDGIIGVPPSSFLNSDKNNENQTFPVMK